MNEKRDVAAHTGGRVRVGEEKAVSIADRKKGSVLLVAIAVTVVVTLIALVGRGDTLKKVSEILVGAVAGVGSRPFEDGTDKEELEKSTGSEDANSVEDATNDIYEESNDEIDTDNDAPSVSLPLYVEKDISEVDRGNAYIVNDTGKAINVAEMLSRGFEDPGDIKPGVPVVLIVHSETMDKYIDEEHPELAFDVRGVRGVVSVGEYIAAKLNRMGITTVHCAAIHVGVGAEGDTADTVRTMLKIYPTVKYVIDIGRQELAGEGGEVVKTVANDPVRAAQIRLSVSLWGDGDGREDNMLLALELRDTMNRGGKHLCAPILLTQSQYNSALSRYYLKVDVGATGNTTTEALAAGEYFAEVFANVIN